MKWTICLLTVILVGCNDTSLKERELDLKERELELREQEIESTKNNNDSKISTYPQSLPQSLPQTYAAEPPKSQTKFAFIVINASIPTLKTVELEQYKSTDGNGFSTRLGDLYRYDLVMQPYTYTSEIVEIQNYSRDEEYRMMDAFERTIRETLSEMDSRYKQQAFQQLMSSESEKYEAQSTIKNKKCYVFDTYEKASVDRNQRITSNE